MKIIPGNAQHIGARREQQDDFGFSDLNDRDFVAHGGVLAVVADGMGGLARGREASRAAKQAMLRAYAAKDPEESIPAALRRALEAANTAVGELSRQVGLEGEVGTTLAAAVVKDRELTWISVGDSRIYLCRGGELARITADHNFGRKLDSLAEAGRISRAEALADPNRHALTSFLGLPALTEVDAGKQPSPLAEGDRILLCSDGLYGSLAVAEMAALLAGGAQQAAESLIAAALAKEKPSQDNLTAAILACEPGSLLPRLAGLPVLAGFYRRRPGWALLAAALLIGALSGAGGIWAANKYRLAKLQASRLAQPPAAPTGPAKPAQAAQATQPPGPAGSRPAADAANIPAGAAGPGVAAPDRKKPGGVPPPPPQQVRIMNPKKPVAAKHSKGKKSKVREKKRSRQKKNTRPDAM